MTSFFTYLIALLSLPSLLSAFWQDPIEASFSIGSGYREGKLEWKTGIRVPVELIDLDHPSSSIHLLVDAQSQLIWRHLKILELQAQGKYVAFNRVYFRGHTEWGFIFSGENQDSDFIAIHSKEGNLPKTEFSRTYATTRGNVYDISVAIGYQFKFCHDLFSLSPLLGYSWHHQKVRMRNLEVAIIHPEIINQLMNMDETNEIQGHNKKAHFLNLDSSYSTFWDGLWVGFDLNYQINCTTALSSSYEYHFANYAGKGDWNLRKDLPYGFRHSAKQAHGHLFTLQASWLFCPNWTLSVVGKMEWWHAHHGKDIIPIEEETLHGRRKHSVIISNLKEANWRSAALAIQLGVLF